MYHYVSSHEFALTKALDGSDCTLALGSTASIISVHYMANSKPIQSVCVH